MSLNSAGFNGGKRCEAEKTKWLEKGERSSIYEVLQSLSVAMGIQVSDNSGQGQEMWVRTQQSRAERESWRGANTYNEVSTGAH